MLGRQELIDLVWDQLWPGYCKEEERLQRIDHWYRWKQERIRIPRNATPELRALSELSHVPWLNLVVSAVAQCLFVDGVRFSLDQASDEQDEASPPWKTWHANGMDQRQVAIHRAALAYGYCYELVLPGEDHEGKRSVLRGVSPRKGYAVYEAPAEDDWPEFFMKVDRKKGKHLLTVYDEQYSYSLTIDTTGAKPEYQGAEIHGADVCPAVRFCNMLDLDGRATGEVEPFIPLAARINKTAYDRMLTQHYSSWKVRTVAGMAAPDDEETKIRKKLQLRQDDILVAEDPDTRFGTLDATPLDGFINAWRSDIESLAAVSQTPTHALTGQLVNLSAEALAASRAGLTQKVHERQKAFGAAHVQGLRLGAQLEGHYDYAQDMLSRVTWQDMEIRSMAQAVDALGKAATLLQIPPEALWSRIPGVEKTDVDEWKQLAAEKDPINRYADTLANQSATGAHDPLLNTASAAEG